MFGKKTLKRYSPKPSLELPKVVYAIADNIYDEDDLNEGEFRFKTPPYSTEQEALDVYGSYGQVIVKVPIFDTFKILWTWDVQTHEWVEYEKAKSST